MRQRTKSMIEGLIDDVRVSYRAGHFVVSKMHEPRRCFAHNGLTNLRGFRPVRHTLSGSNEFPLRNPPRHTALQHGRKVDSLLSYVRRYEFKDRAKCRSVDYVFWIFCKWLKLKKRCQEKIILNRGLSLRQRIKPTPLPSLQDLFL